MNTSDAGANYLLTVLLPRLEDLKPGLIDELAKGIEADKNAIEQSGKMNPEIEEVFRSAQKILAGAVT